MSLYGYKRNKKTLTAYSFISIPKFEIIPVINFLLAEDKKDILSKFIISFLVACFVSIPIEKYTEPLTLNMHIHVFYKIF